MSKIQVIEQEVRANVGRSVTVESVKSALVRNEKGHIKGSRVEVTLAGNGIGSPQRRNYVRTKLNERLAAMGVVTKFTRTSKGAETATLVVETAA